LSKAALIFIRIKTRIHELIIQSGTWIVEVRELRDFFIRTRLTIMNTITGKNWTKNLAQDLGKVSIDPSVLITLR
jgi:hypothetical protein